MTPGAEKGFRLHDLDTWRCCNSPDVPSLKLVWTPTLLALIPDIVAIAHTNQERAIAFLEKLLSFVQGRSELSESMVGRILEQCSIKGQSRQKQHDVRKFLVEQGLINKQRNYFCDKATGYRHGNFYVCGLEVRFREEEEQARHTTHTVSIYLSFDNADNAAERFDEQEQVLYRRYLACEERYRERIAWLRQRFRQAA